MAPRFDVNPTIEKQIKAVIGRAAVEEIIVSENEVADAMFYDLAGCHLNVMPLDFEKMLLLPHTDFVMELYGIGNFMDRKNLRFLNDYVPLCAK